MIAVNAQNVSAMVFIIQLKTCSIRKSLFESIIKPNWNWSVGGNSMYKFLMFNIMGATCACRGLSEAGKLSISLSTREIYEALRIGFCVGSANLCCRLTVGGSLENVIENPLWRGKASILCKQKKGAFCASSNIYIIPRAELHKDDFDMDLFLCSTALLSDISWKFS